MSPTIEPLIWTIGSGGLVGRAIQRASARTFDGPLISWHDSNARQAILREASMRFLESAGDDPWALVWAAGVGTVGTAQELLTSEVNTVADFTHMFGELLREAPDTASRGICVLISSAGGVYAGSPHPPYSIDSLPRPLSPYGTAKLEQESMWSGAFSQCSSSLIARVSNVYGEDQSIRKRQGLITQLAYAAATRQPLSIYVPLDTVRDYIHADDAVTLIIHHIQDQVIRSREEGPTDHTTIIASGQGTSIAALLRMMTDVCHRKIPIAVAPQTHTVGQALDSRFIPTLPAGFTTAGARPLPLGLRQVYQGIIGQLQDAGVASRILAH